MDKKAFTAIIPLAALCFAACDILPAEETIEDIGAANFVAGFEVPGDVAAPWEESDKLLVIDTKNSRHRFGLDTGASTSAGDFSGEISPGSQVKYVAYASDADAITYNPEEESFSLTIPAVYNAKAADALVSENNAAIGTLQGSEVLLKSVCGFVKFTLEPNGKTLEQGGITYQLTDLRTITITDSDGKLFAGTVSATWPEGATAPVYAGIENGSSSITFRTRTLTTPDGDIYYQAGDYYIPVAPQNYENVSIVVEDSGGHSATAVKNRALSVQQSMTSNLNTVSWPTVVLSVNLNCSTATESNTHPDIMSFPLPWLSVDHTSNTTGALVVGTSQQKTAVEFTEGGVTYQLWATNGYGRNEKSSKVLGDIWFNYYNANQTIGGHPYNCGLPNGYAWIRIPEYNGVLYKIDLQIMSTCTGPFYICNEVDAETGGPVDVIASEPTSPKSAFSWFYLNLPDLKANTPCYICMGDGYSYRVRAWNLYYKVYE